MLITLYGIEAKVLQEKYDHGGLTWCAAEAGDSAYSGVLWIPKTDIIGQTFQSIPVGEGSPERGNLWRRKISVTWSLSGLSFST
jgi:hypothetical protein